MTLSGTAGLGGVSKPGRWTPIIVSVDASEAASGLLIVQWGDATAERTVAVAAGATKRFEFYLHTMEVSAAASARMVRHGQTLAAIDLPIRALEPAEPFTLCVTDGGSVPGIATECAATTIPASLPRSLRGYDAVDSVAWQAGAAETALPEDQRRALQRWRVAHALDLAGSLAATDRPPSIMAALARKNHAPSPLRAVMTAFLVLLVLAIGATRRRRAGAVHATMLVAVVCGAGAVLAAGRLGPGSSVLVHHATLVQQLPGSNGSIVTMRGAMEFPARDEFAVEAIIADAAIETGRRQAIAENGYPAVRGTFSAGARHAFSLEGVIDARLLGITRRGSILRVVNEGSVDLRECRFAGGSSPVVADVLRPGQAIETTQPHDVVGPIVTCRMPGSPVEFAAANHEVRAEGRTLLAAYLAPGEEGSR